MFHFTVLCLFIDLCNILEKLGVFFLPPDKCDQIIQTGSNLVFFVGGGGGLCLKQNKSTCFNLEFYIHTVRIFLGMFLEKRVRRKKSMA